MHCHLRMIKHVNNFSVSGYACLHMSWSIIIWQTFFIASFRSIEITWKGSSRSYTEPYLWTSPARNTRPPIPQPGHPPPRHSASPLTQSSTPLPPQHRVLLPWSLPVEMRSTKIQLVHNQLDTRNMVCWLTLNNSQNNKWHHQLTHCKRNVAKISILNFNINGRVQYM
jgi:hypothetical protein